MNMKNENQIKFKSAQNKSENMCKIVNMYLKKQCRKQFVIKKMHKSVQKNKKGLTFVLMLTNI